MKNKVQVLINNISEIEWSNEIDNCLWLIEQDIEIYSSISTINKKEIELGQIIFEDYLKGKLFVKGIYVKELSKYNFEKNLPGFNSINLKTNRDRNIIQNDYELKKDLSSIISGSFNNNLKYLRKIQNNEKKHFSKINMVLKNQIVKLWVTL